MSWNCSIVVVPGATLNDVRAAGVEVAGERVYGELATSMEFAGIAAGEADGSLVLLCSDLSLETRQEELAVLLGRDVYGALFAGVSGIYTWQVGGPSGQRVRIVSEGEVVADQGEPHPAEAGVDDLDEDALFDLLARATGYTAVLDGSAEPEGGGFHPVTFPEPQGTGVPGRKRGWFRRR